VLVIGDPEGAWGRQSLTAPRWGGLLLAEKKKELTHLVEESALAGRRSGRRLLVNNGSFYDWLGEPVPLCPDWGRGYDVLPDDQAGEVESLKKARLRAQEAIAASPTSQILEYLQEKVGHNVTERKDRWDEAMAGLKVRLREDTPWCWQELRAVETVLEEVAQEFGEDPLIPPVRNVLDKAHQELAELPTWTLSTCRSTSPRRMRSGWRSSGSGCSARTRSTLSFDDGRTCQKFRHLDAFETFWDDAGAGLKGVGKP